MKPNLLRRFWHDRLNPALYTLQKRLAQRQAVILMYHQIDDVAIDPWGLCVTPQRFAEQLQVLQAHARPISLQQLVQSQGKLDRRAVAITFDDGYANNLHQAKPLLEQYNLPATVFVTTGYLGCERGNASGNAPAPAREFWWDELAQLLLQPGKLPDRLILADHSQRWDLGTAAEYSPAAYQRDRHQRAWQALPGSRLHFYHLIWQWLQPLDHGDRQAALDQIAGWCGIVPQLRPSHRPLTTAELVDLARGPLIEIGAHTITHPQLSTQTPTVQQSEIQRSKADLETLLQRPITSFSYPFGDRTDTTGQLAQAAGLSCACTTVESSVWRRSHRWQLPRMGVQNWQGKEFSQQLARWFDD